MGLPLGDFVNMVTPVFGKESRGREWGGGRVCVPYSAFLLLLHFGLDLNWSWRRDDGVYLQYVQNG